MTRVTPGYNPSPLRTPSPVFSPRRVKQALPHRHPSTTSSVLDPVPEVLNSSTSDRKASTALGMAAIPPPTEPGDRGDPACPAPPNRLAERTRQLTHSQDVRRDDKLRLLALCRPGVWPRGSQS